MYNSVQQQLPELETSEKKTLNLKFGYSKSRGKDLSSAINFVLRKLDFIPLSPIAEVIFDEDRLVTQNGDGKQIYIHIHRMDSNDFDNIVVYTNDCLRDYHQYITRGVEFTSRPQYCSKGLKVDFYGENDNLYTLLEERDYMNG